MISLYSRLEISNRLVKIAIVTCSEFTTSLLWLTLVHYIDLLLSYGLTIKSNNITQIRKLRRSNSYYARFPGLFHTNVPINSSGRLFHSKSGHKADWFHFGFEENRFAEMRFELRALGSRGADGGRTTPFGSAFGNFFTSTAR